MTSIPVGTFRISSNNFKRHYLEKKRLFLDFLLDFRNVHEISNILKKIRSILGLLLPKLLHPKEMFT